MTAIQNCRACGAADLLPILSLGNTPLANSLRSESQLAEPEKTYPLELVFCPACTLVQITETVDPHELFRHYLYFSSFSETMIAHASTLSRRLISELNLNSKSMVVEIASNDGYLLKNYASQGIPVLGIEPAKNVASAATEKGIHTLPEFFNLELARRLTDDGFRADVVHAHNVLAHVADLQGVVAGIAALLKDNGTAVIETPYIKDLIDRCEFDTIYHEHLCYYSVTALEHLFRRHDLRIVNVERIPIHGGSIRLFVSRRDLPADSVRQILEEEKNWGVDRMDYYAQFGKRVEKLRSALCNLIRQLKADGAKIAVYGASAKGSTLLNYFGLGKNELDFVVDRSSVKQGFFTPGTHLPIHPPEALLERRPDYVLLLTWNFRDEILEQQKAYRDAGGKFIIPIPEVEIV
jgi:SAM-dependent methyltransferase